MCKILIVPHVPVGKEANLLRFFKAASQPMTGTSDNDGLGYALMKEDGTIAGERWLVNADAWKFRVNQEKANLQSRLSKKYANVLSFPSVYSQFGDESEEDVRVVAGMLHTRFATSAKGIDNAHPFYRPTLTEKGQITHDNIALIHNGVIRNDNTWKADCFSTNDSEAILCNYLNHSIQYNPDGMVESLKELQGYYAFAVMTQDFNGNMIVDIARDAQAKLCMAYIEELGAEVFCTNIEIVEATVKKLKWHIVTAALVADNTYVRINAVTGDVLFKDEIKGYEYKPHKSYWQQEQEDSQRKILEASAAKKALPIVTPDSNLSDEECAIAKMSDEEFSQWCDVKSRMNAEDFHSDDPDEVAMYIRSIKEA